MKSRKLLFLLIIGFLASFIIIGCSTTPARFSFSEDEQKISSISFQSGNPGVAFVSYSGQTLPKPEKKTHWDPIVFASGRELRIIVHANYSTSSKTSLSGFGLLGAVVNTVQDVRAATRNVDTDLVFICPALEVGKIYQLNFNKEPGMPGKNILTLIDSETKKIIKQQEFEVVFGGDEVK